MFQIPESTGEVLQPVLQVEVFFFQSVDGILELIGWAAVWKQRNQPPNCGDLQDWEHCGISEEIWLDATWLVKSAAGQCPVIFLQLQRVWSSGGSGNVIQELSYFCVKIDLLMSS